MAVRRYAWVVKGLRGMVVRMAGKGSVAARERARLAKVKRYAQEVERDKKVEDNVTDFYLASDALEAAQAAVTVARARMAGLVRTLVVELKEPVNGAAVLCDISEAQVRALRKEATTADAEPASGSAPDAQAAPGPTAIAAAPNDAPDEATGDEDDGTESDETGEAPAQRRAS